MHDYMPELDGPQSYRDCTGRMILCKGGKKGGKSGGIGSILGIAASIAIPFAAPALAASIGVTSTMGVAAVGAGLGATSAAITGGDPLKGAIFGGIGGGLGQAGGLGNGMVEGGSFTSNLGAGWDNFTGGLGIGGGAQGGMSGMSGMSEVGTGVGYGQTLAPEGWAAGASDLAGSGITDVAATGWTGDYNSVGQLGGTGDFVSAGTGNYAAGGDFAGALTRDPTQMGSFGGMTEGVTAAGDPTYIANAPSGKSFFETGAGQMAGKAGLQLAGSMLSDAPEAPDYTQVLRDQMAQDKEVFEYNKGQNAKKNAIGDSIQANILPPSYYAENSANDAKRRSDEMWQQAEAQMRAQGRDDAYINAEKARSGHMSNLNQSTAYTGGYNQGYNNQMAGLTTAGGMYGPLSGGPDRTGAAVAASAASSAQDNAAGKSLEDIFGLNAKKKEANAYAPG